jgi:Ran-binding protein 1
LLIVLTSKEEEVKSSSPTIERKRTDSESGCPSSPEIHFEPIIQLPLIDVKTLEENEEEVIKL